MKKKIKKNQKKFKKHPVKQAIFLSLYEDVCKKHFMYLEKRIACPE